MNGDLTNAPRTERVDSVRDAYATVEQLRRLWSEDALHMSGAHVAAETLRLLGLPPNDDVEERQN